MECGSDYNRFGEHANEWAKECEFRTLRQMCAGRKEKKEENCAAYLDDERRGDNNNKKH